ncbi:DNA-binding protein [Aurantimonas sp. 22II-16-19i]|nr:DNA-binding protein [Aurantimonas sp. 22II-16-19i]
MTQAQIAELFGRDVSVVSRPIANVVEEGELEEEGNLQEVQIASATRPVTLDSLDMIISVGYRVSSAKATVFRRWATAILVQFAKKGFVVDTPRLKQRENADRVAELREIIRDLRSDEANLYRELRAICALCQDDGTTKTATEFFQRTQATGLCRHVANAFRDRRGSRRRQRRDHGPDHLAERHHPQTGRRRFEDLSGATGDPRTQPADHHPPRHLRRPAGDGPARRDGGRIDPARPAVARSRTCRPLDGRAGERRRGEAPCRGRICDIRRTAKARAAPKRR